MAICLATCTRNSTSSSVQTSPVVLAISSVPSVPLLVTNGTEQADLQPKCHEPADVRRGVAIQIAVANDDRLAGRECLRRRHPLRVNVLLFFLEKLSTGEMKTRPSRAGRSRQVTTARRNRGG